MRKNKIFNYEMFNKIYQQKKFHVKGKFGG